MGLLPTKPAGLLLSYIGAESNQDLARLVGRERGSGTEALAPCNFIGNRRRFRNSP